MSDRVVSQPARPVSRLRLLVVDDNVDAAEALSQLLKQSGHEVRLATDGPAALDTVAQAAPDVIFLDIGMPGMSGYDVARALREMPRGEEFVIVAVTGWGTAEDKSKAKAAGFDHHLTKPADFDAVEQILESVTND